MHHKTKEGTNRLGYLYVFSFIIGYKTLQSRISSHKAFIDNYTDVIVAISSTTGGFHPSE